MGDAISLQYGGSEAHHTALNKKKNFFKNALPELLTSVKRHYANNFLDPMRQNIINLFLGIYVPLENIGQDLWSLTGDEKIQKIKQNQKLPNIRGNWWEQFMRKYDPTLPTEFQIDLDKLFTHTKDESDEGEDKSHNSLSKNSNNSSSQYKTPRSIRDDDFFKVDRKSS